MAGDLNPRTGQTDNDLLRAEVSRLKGEISQLKSDKYYLNKRLDAQSFLIELHRKLAIGFTKQIGILNNALKKSDAKAERLSRKIHRLENRGKDE